jgi:hypothetical protein
VYRSGKTRYRPSQRRHRSHFDGSYTAKYSWLASLSTLLMCTIDTARPFPKGRPTQPPQSTPGTWARTGPSARRSHGWVAKPAKLKPLTSRRSRVDAGGRKRARGSPRTALGTASASPIHVVMDEQSAGRSPRNADAGGPLMQRLLSTRGGAMCVAAAESKCRKGAFPLTSTERFPSASTVGGDLGERLVAQRFPPFC